MNTKLAREIKSCTTDVRVIFLGFISDLDVLNNSGIIQIYIFMDIQLRKNRP